MGLTCYGKPKYEYLPDLAEINASCSELCLVSEDKLEATSEYADAARGLVIGIALVVPGGKFSLPPLSLSPLSLFLSPLLLSPPLELVLCLVV